MSFNWLEFIDKNRHLTDFIDTPCPVPTSFRPLGSFSAGSYSVSSFGFGSYNFSSYNFGSFHGSFYGSFTFNEILEILQHEPLNQFGYGIDLI